MKRMVVPASSRSRFCFSSAVLLLAALPVRADNKCRSIEVLFNPAGVPRGIPPAGREELAPQIAVWLEDPRGTFLTDVYVTRLVGLLGLGNRPGQALLKSDFRWPYGRRPMALPVWAHARGKSYGFVVMGGRCSRTYDPADPKNTTCPRDFTGDPSDDDRTIAYHGPVSSDEPFYCSPSGWRPQQQGGVDVVSCASAFYGSKGWYAPGLSSPYPPRADLDHPGPNDHPDVARFARDNDVAAVSSATPPVGRVLDPPIGFHPPAGSPGSADGDYVMKIEVNREADFNSFWGPGKSVPEPHSEWDNLGKEFLGQPSIVYAVPFRLDASGRIATALDYAGYGDWRGDTGALHPPDATISDKDGSGADRLLVNTDDNGSWRVKVSVVPCGTGPCVAPVPPAALDLSEHSDSTITVRFPVPAGEPAVLYQVKYLPDVPLGADNFDRAMPATPPTLGPPGQVVKTVITGLRPQTRYYLGARALSRCGKASPLTTGDATTVMANFTTLSGCFVATAAYGSGLQPEVARLRRFRDRHLLKGPAGQLFVAAYYALSPPLAAMIGQSEGLRSLARRALSLLAPLVKAAVSH